MADTAIPMRVAAERLEEFTARAFQAVGISAAEAKSIAGLMVRANLQGSEGHGIFQEEKGLRPLF